MELKQEKNFDAIRQNSIRQFHKEVQKAEAEYFNQLNPFCSRCAKIDFRDMVERQITEQTRSHGFVTDFNTIFKQIDLKEYGKPERFLQLEDKPAKEPLPGQVSGGTLRRTFQYGIFRSYQCKERGCGISIEVSNEQLEKEKVNKGPLLKKK